MTQNGQKLSKMIQMFEMVKNGPKLPKWQKLSEIVQNIKSDPKRHRGVFRPYLLENSEFRKFLGDEGGGVELS